MKAMVLETLDGPDGLVLKDLPDPEPGPGEVLVRLRAASLNFRDTLILKGGYRKLQKHSGLIPLSDGAGEVAALGPGVTGFKEGERVAVNFCLDWLAGEPTQQTIHSDLGRDRDGLLCEYAVLPAHALLPLPDTLSFVEAAALPCAGLTAWSAVVALGEAKPGDLVLTQGTGGVSLFALQFAVMAGCEVICTSSSDEKLARARELGADYGISYRSDPHWGKAALEISGGRGIDNVIELGGTETLKQSLMAVRPGGTISMIGVLSGATFGDILLPFVVSRKVRLQGVTVGHRQNFEDMLRALATHDIKPVIDSTYPLAEAAEAFRHLESGAHFGKVCIEI